MMTQDDPCFTPEVEALLERGRSIRPVPDIVRARALARARASVATAGRPLEAQPIVRRRGLVLALAASVALVVIAVSAGAALLRRTPQNVVIPAVAPEPAPASTKAPILESETPPSAPRAPIVSTKPQRPGRAVLAQDSYAAELELLQHVQAAYARESFASALALIAEHGRRFPHGRLIEEREVLRIRALAGAGRMDEARRAAAAFAERFPRSIVLPRLSRELR